MTKILFAKTVPTIPVAGRDERFAVQRIYCVGQNYAAHAREMGGDPERVPPFYFSKPADAVVPDGSVLAFPMHTENLHHEIELVAALGVAGHNVAASEALTHVFGYAINIEGVNEILLKFSD
jgi:fumarylpyruvate hydrolase